MDDPSAQVLTLRSTAFDGHVQTFALSIAQVARQQVCRFSIDSSSGAKMRATARASNRVLRHFSNDVLELRSGDRGVATLFCDPPEIEWTIRRNAVDSILLRLRLGSIQIGLLGIMAELAKGVSSSRCTAAFYTDITALDLVDDYLRKRLFEE